MAWQDSAGILPFAFSSREMIEYRLTESGKEEAHQKGWVYICFTLSCFETSIRRVQMRGKLVVGGFEAFRELLSVLGHWIQVKSINVNG